MKNYRVACDINFTQEFIEELWVSVPPEKVSADGKSAIFSVADLTKDEIYCKGCGFDQATIEELVSQKIAFVEVKIDTDADHEIADNIFKDIRVIALFCLNRVDYDLFEEWMLKRYTDTAYIANLWSQFKNNPLMFMIARDELGLMEEVIKKINESGYRG